jgi:hypothetical protein
VKRDQSWHQLAEPRILKKMEETEGTLMAICDDERAKALPLLATNIRSLQLIHDHINSDPDNPMVDNSELDDGLLLDPSGEYGVSHLMIQQVDTGIPSFDGMTLDEIREIRNALMAEQGEYRRAIKGEINREAEEQEEIAERQADATPVVMEWLKMLADNEVLKDMYVEKKTFDDCE